VPEPPELVEVDDLEGEVEVYDYELGVLEPESAAETERDADQDPAAT
jgi:hypothetical protein